MEIANVFSLYFKHETKMFNGIGVFKAWEKSKEDSEVHDLVKYLVFWVAGTKVIFLSLIVVILILGDPLTQYISVLVLIISISTFYFRLFPLARKMDIENQLDPKGYSKVLGIMIACMMFALFLGFLVTFFTQ
jgi:hypothetical protein